MQRLLGQFMDSQDYEVDLALEKYEVYTFGSIVNEGETVRYRKDIQRVFSKTFVSF